MAPQLLLLLLWLTLAWASQETKPSCEARCGNINIPYPFGIGEACSRGARYNLICNTSYTPPKLFPGNVKVEIIEIFPTQLRINNLIASTCYAQTGAMISDTMEMITLVGTPYTFSDTANKFTGIGCDTIAIIAGSSEATYSSGCLSLCDNKDNVIDGPCTGSGCCQIPIPKGLKGIVTTTLSLDNHTKIWSFNPCSYAFIADHEHYTFKASDLLDPNFLNNTQNVPVVLDWVVGKETCEEAQRNLSTYACQENSKCDYSDNGAGYRCLCKQGYRGNPYLSPGCQDINECEENTHNCEEICNNTPGSFFCTCSSGTYDDGEQDGIRCIPSPKDNKLPLIQVTLGTGLAFLCLLLGSSWLYWGLQKRKLIKLKEKFFKQNGGQLLQQQMSAHEGTVETTKIFTAEELKKATDNYAENRILGRGGYGTVYKGILADHRIVAVKKSKIVDENQIEQFINEVVILSQINHRNVVRLLGCCLETEVPLLIYEFINNGTLFHHIHDEGHVSSISWEIRLRIAAETAGALAYLHSAVSTPIIHRDIKSANILLDENYTSKIADFGASRLVPLDQTQLTTLVQGTLGYLDPEYFHSSQLTEKSDVYSFGVVLVELLTGKKALSFERPQEERNLCMYFISSLKNNNLFEVLEGKVMEEGSKEQLEEVSELAKRCLRVNGEERPTMKEVAMELERLRGFKQHPWVKQDPEESVLLLGESSDSCFGSTTGYNSLKRHMVLSIDGGR